MNKDEHRIYIECMDRNIDGDTEKLIRKVVDECLSSEKIDIPVNIDIYICGNDYIRGINKEYREIDRATDVLSFPMTESTEGKLEYGPGDFEDGHLVLGEIVLSTERAAEQAEEYGHSVEREIGYLISHGIFHLLGYDHEKTEDAEKMFARQESVMTALGLRRGNEL